MLMTQLYEIYLENDETAFTVGSIVAETEELYIVESLDETGRLDSFQVRPKAKVGKLVSPSKYLELMEFTKNYNVENGNYNPLGLEVNYDDYSSLEGTFHQMRNSGDIYTIVTDTDEEILIGNVKEVFEKDIVIAAIDFEDFTQTEVPIDKNEIVAIDILSYENVLLQKFLMQR